MWGMHMDFSLKEEQISFKSAVIKFAESELNVNIEEREKKGTFSDEGWRKCADFGIQALPLPKEYEGLEKDILTCVLTMEGLGYSCKDSGLLFALNSHIWTCEIPLLNFGTEEQKEKYLPGMCNGALIGGHAMTESDAGSDAFSLKTSAVRNGDKYILNGTKMFISNAPIADILLVFACTDKQKGFAGVSAFIVEKGFPGFSVGKPLDKMGLRTAPTGEVILNNCEVPVENRLGREGAGAAIFNSEMEWERSCLFACHLGAMEAQLNTCVNYAQERQQFGSPIGKFQSISNKLADMKVRIELARLILYKVAWLKSQGKRAPLESAIAKLYLSESFVESSLDAIQIHGGYGYMTEFGVERNLRDSIAGKIYSGTSEIQKNIIASFLGL
jgi:alkylation response protein AidB-like acyl-CoA dehydrogenase